MQFKLATAVAVIGFCAAGTAHAETYLAAGVNQATAQVNGIQFDPNVGYDVAIGHKFGPVRAEVGYSRLAGDAMSVVDAHADDFHGDAFLDVHLGGLTLSPGVGLDYIQGEATVGGHQIGELSGGWDWSLGGQASVAITDRIAVDLTYRDIQSADIQVAGLRLRARI